QYTVATPLRALVAEQSVGDDLRAFFVTTLQQNVESQSNPKVRLERRNARELPRRERFGRYAIEQLSNTAVYVEASAARFADAGWLEPDSRRFQILPLLRQLDAIDGLKRASGLHNQLNDPIGTIHYDRDRSKHSAGLK